MRRTLPTIALVLAGVATACDLKPLVVPEERQGPEAPVQQQDSGDRPMIVSREGGAPTMVSSMVQPDTVSGSGERPQHQAGSGATPGVLSSDARLSTATPPAGPVSHVLWQNISTGVRGFWPMSGPAYAGGWDALGHVPLEWDIAGMGDFNGDNKPDVVWQNTSNGSRGAWPMNGSAYVGGWISFGEVPVAWDIAAVVDFTGDGKTDILWQDRVTGQRGIWEMNGGTFVNWHGIGGVPLEWDIAAAADFTGDGKTDILWHNTNSGVVGIWPMDGTVYTGGWHVVSSVPTMWRVGGAADFTGDGRPDVVWQSLSSGQRGFWAMNGIVYEGAFYDWGGVPTEWRVVGALIAPPPTARIRTWTGSSSTNWNVAGNWQEGTVPAATDTAVIPVTTNQPVLTSSVQIAGVRVASGATLNLATYDLTATGDVATETTGGITSLTGRLILTGVARTIRGIVPRVRVTGTYSLTGNLTVRAPFEVVSGRLTDTSFRLQITSN